jgi:MFS family permease
MRTAVANMTQVLHFNQQSLAASPQTAKALIRTSLSASTTDGIFATVFTNLTAGVLLTNFLVEQGASALEIGWLSAIPMIANLLQPVGAYLSELTNSRHNYCLWIYAPARLSWLILGIGIALKNHDQISDHTLIYWALGVLMITHILGALGSAAWLSWMAVLVPRRLRGRYFSLRNIMANLTSFISVPLAGAMVSQWPGGTLQGYRVVMMFGVAAGLISLGFQYFMIDVNPQLQRLLSTTPQNPSSAACSANPSDPDDSDLNAQVINRKGVLLTAPEPSPSLFQDTSFLFFLLYFSLGMFAINLSAPFFNFYLLDHLKLSINQVIAYNSLMAAANLLALLGWGKLVDRIGNRPILIGVGLLGALVPLLWLITGENSVSVWVWLPLLHVLIGGTGAALDLCSNNLQIGIAPLHHQSAYFGITAAFAGVSGALGTSVGGLLVDSNHLGGFFSLFVISSVLRVGALLPLIFVHEQPHQSLKQLMQILLPNADASA